MAQSTILAAGVDGSTSSDVVLAAGAVATIGLFVSSGTLQPGTRALVYVDTPGADNIEAELDHIRKETQVVGPATYRVQRLSAPAAFGVFSET